jgi:hypothetical protein
MNLLLLSRNFWRKVVLCALFIVFSLLVYRPWRPAEFLLWDDRPHIADNPLFHPITTEHLRQIWTEPYEGLYIPLTYSVWGGIVFVIQYFYGDNWVEKNVTWPFLTFNLTVHLLNAMAIFLIVRKFKIPDFWTFFCILIFLFHPVQVETVASVSGAKQLLFTFFSLSSILSYVNGRGILVFLFYLMAVLSLPLGAVVPVVLLAFYALSTREWKSITSDRSKLLKLIPFAVISTSVFMMTKSLQPNQFIPEFRPLEKRIFIVLDSFGFYIKKLFLPIPLAFDYGRTPTWLENHLPTYEMGIILIVVSVILVFWLRYVHLRKRLLYFVVTVFSSLIPASGIVPFLQQNYSTVADRYLYFPMFGLATSAALFLNRTSRFFLFLGVILVGSCLYLSFRQVNVWSSNERLFTHNLEINTVSFASENGLGIVESRKGNDQMALQHFQKAFENNSRSLIAVENMGKTLVKLERFQEASNLYTNVLHIDPKLTGVRLDFGALLMKIGKNDEALAEFNKIIVSDPNNIIAHLNTGILLYNLSRPSEAIPHFQLLVKINPENKMYSDYLHFVQNPHRDDARADK